MFIFLTISNLKTFAIFEIKQIKKFGSVQNKSGIGTLRTYGYLYIKERPDRSPQEDYPQKR